MTDAALFALAQQAAARSYAPYSHIHVGAALLCGSGSVYTGANVENASYGATVCAERTALWQAVLGGERTLITLAVAAERPDGTALSAPPCGICRQTLCEFSDGSLRILFGTKENLRECTLAELLPEAFAL